MTLTFDQAAYRNLLAEVAPNVIETEEECDRKLAVGWIDARKPTIHTRPTPPYRLAADTLEVGTSSL